MWERNMGKLSFENILALNGSIPSSFETFLLILMFLMFCWPCIMIYPYKMNQEDVLFTFNLFQ